MGLFSRKGAPTPAGSYKTLWPRESGLGVGPYALEAQQQEEYLVYTTARCAASGVAAEDMDVMQAANTLLYQLAAGTPVDEVPLIQGPVDVQWKLPWTGQEFAAEALITDQRTLIWWDKIKGVNPGPVPPPGSSRSALVIFNHISLVPRGDQKALTPYAWIDGFLVGFPVATPPLVRMFTPGLLTIGVHFAQDGHANRRSMSVAETLREVENRTRTGDTI